MRKLVTMNTCDRCGLTITLDALTKDVHGEGMGLGVGRNGEIPEGWQYLSGMELCTDCYSSFSKFMGWREEE